MTNSKDFIGLQFSELNISDIFKVVSTSKNGRCSISTLIETPQDDCDEEGVKKIKYEAQEAETVNELQVICDTVRSKWGVEKIAIYLRLGEVSLQEPSIVIAVSSYLTQNSVIDMQFILNQVKTLASISKTKIFKDEKTTNGVDSSINFYNQAVQIKDEKFLIETQKIKDKSDDDVNKKIDPNNVQSHCTKEIEKSRIKALCEYNQKKRNEKNMQKNSTFCVTQDDNGDETTVCARVNILYQNTNIVRRVNNKWSDQHIIIDSENKKLPNNERILGINKPVARDIYERIKNVEDRLSILEDIDPKYKYLLRTEKCLKCSEKALNSLLVEKRKKQTSVLDERLSINEMILGISKPVPRDVYERLENLENRVLYLESCSPDYETFSITEKCQKCSDDQADTKSSRKRVYSSSEEDR